MEGVTISNPEVPTVGIVRFLGLGRVSVTLMEAMNDAAVAELRSELPNLPSRRVTVDERVIEVAWKTDKKAFKESVAVVRAIMAALELAGTLHKIVLPEAAHSYWQHGQSEPAQRAAINELFAPTRPQL